MAARPRAEIVSPCHVDESTARRRRLYRPTRIAFQIAKNAALLTRQFHREMSPCLQRYAFVGRVLGDGRRDDG